MADIKKCILTKNDCYKKGVIMTPKGIVVHSTGANNKTLRRYVQPDDGYLGINSYGNHWNQSGTGKCVNAFIGVDKNGKVKTYQTLPWNMKPWGCKSGPKGSYNNTHIQFEICEDGLADKTYFDEAFKQAIELCAYLCQKYSIPITNIVSHKEAHAKGYASDHGDCDYWLKKFGKDMNWFRAEVKKELERLANPVPVKKAYSGTFPVVPPNLKKGSKGTQVNRLQKFLNWYGGYGLVADSILGNASEKAIKDFQTKEKLSSDGIFGAKSLEKAKTIKR